MLSFVLISQHSSIKIRSLVQLFDLLPENERIITDVLRQIVLENLPGYCKEKISFDVLYFYGKKGHMYHLAFNHATNEQIFYKIFHPSDEIDEQPIIKLLKVAVRIDGHW